MNVTLFGNLSATDGSELVVVGTVSPIVVSGLRKTYGSHVAVDSVDLEVYPGEVFALLGPNGAGKTTTVEILEGIRTRDRGDVEVLGHDPSRRRRAWRAQIGVVPQSTGAYLDLTVREVVRQFASYYPAPLHVDQVIDMVGLGEQQKQQSSSLSGGQRRRLDVAVGIVGDPQLIFLDEPTTGLDPVARREAWDLIRYFASRGKTTVLTTHYLDEAEALAQRAAIIVDGRVRALGTMTELGGRSGTPITVTFRLPPEMRQLQPAQLPDGSTMQLTGETVTISTHLPSEVLRRLLGWAGHAGVAELPDLRVHQPSLEDIYLQLINRDGRAEEVA